jgi:hypothetical protein|tara:strand:+ start:114 stop:338 length:225 start_codon:yes stop_codon:yes gene_type:complete
MTDFNTDIETFDDAAFSVFKTRWGTYAARDTDGKGLCSGLDRDSVIFWAREHLNGFANSTAHTRNVTMKGDMLK